MLPVNRFWIWPAVMVFKRAGLKDTQWGKIEVDPEGVRKFGHDFWRDFLVYEPIIGIVSKR